MKTHNEAELRRSMADIPMIGDMSITDEHKLVPLKTKMKVILNILKKEPSTAVILHDGKGKKMKIVGVITAEEVEAAINKGKKPKKLKIDDVTLTKILELPSNIPITKALEVIQNKGPDAVIVRNYESRDFAGFFSVDDFREAKDIISQQKQRAQEFQQNTQSTMQKSALQQEMEDDDDSYVPEAMRSLPLSPELKATFKTQAEEGSVKANSDKTPVDKSARIETLDERPNDSPPSVPWEDSPPSTTQNQLLSCPYCADQRTRGEFLIARDKCPTCAEPLSKGDLAVMMRNALIAQDATVPAADQATVPAAEQEICTSCRNPVIQRRCGVCRSNYEVAMARVPCPYCAEEDLLHKFNVLQSCPTCAEPLSSEDLAALEVIAAQVAEEGSSAQERSDLVIGQPSKPSSAAEKAVLVAQVPCPYCAEEDLLHRFNVLQSCPTCAEPLSSEDLAALEVIATAVAGGRSTTQFSPPSTTQFSPPSTTQFSPPSTTQNQMDRDTCPNCGLFTAVILPDESYRCISCGERGSFVATVPAADQATWDLCNPSAGMGSGLEPITLQSRLESVNFYLSSFPDGVYVIPATLLRNQLIASAELVFQQHREAGGDSAPELVFQQHGEAGGGSALERVVITTRSKPEEYICPECNSVFTNGSDLKQHRRMDWETGTLVCLDENNDDPNDSPP